MTRRDYWLPTSRQNIRFPTFAFLLTGRRVLALLLDLRSRRRYEGVHEGRNAVMIVNGDVSSIQNEPGCDFNATCCLRTIAITEAPLSRT